MLFSRRQKSKRTNLKARKPSHEKTVKFCIFANLFVTVTKERFFLLFATFKKLCLRNIQSVRLRLHEGLEVGHTDPRNM